MTTVKYPNMRQELKEHLRALSDPEYQQRVWVGGASDGPVEHDEFDYAVHFLFDDTKLASDAGSTIGSILRDMQEASLVSSVVTSVEEVFRKYGTELTDAEYMSKPEWHQVVSAAKSALDGLGD